MQVLIADDHAGVRERVAAMVQELHKEAEIFFFSEGKHVLDHPSASISDLLIIDVNMPGMGGMEVLKRLRASSNLPVILISSHCENQYANAALAAGANAFINKQSLGDKLPELLEKLFAKAGDENKHTKNACSTNNDMPL